MTATSAVFGKEQGDLLPGFVGDLSAPDHTHSSSARALYEQKLSWIFVFIRQTLVGRNVTLGTGVAHSVAVEEVEAVVVLLVEVDHLPTRVLGAAAGTTGGVRLLGAGEGVARLH